MKRATLYTLGLFLLASFPVVHNGAAATFVQNPSFESNYNDTYPHYGSIDSWTGGSGVNDDSGPFHNTGTPIPDGTRVAFSQASTSLSQDISGLTPNEQYWVQFAYDARNCCGGTIDVVVKWNDTALTKLPNIKPATGGASYQTATVPFTPDADSGTLTFQTVASGDATALFDGVTIVPRDTNQVPVVNPSFEASGPITGDGTFATNQNIMGWVATGVYGISTAGLGTTADNGAVPDQDNVAFLQGAASIAQTLRNVKVASPVKLSFAYNAKSGQTPHLQVKNGDAVLYEEDVTAVGGTSPYKTKSVAFTATDTLVSIAFAQTKDGQTLLLDDIKVEGQTGVEFAPIAFDPTGLELAPSQSATVKVTVDPAAVALKEISLQLQSPDTNLVALVGADTNGIVTLDFPKGGSGTATLSMQALARGVIRLTVPETGGLKLGDDVSVSVVSSFVRNASFESNPVPAGTGAGAITAWDGGTGLNTANGPFQDNGAIPDRDQVAVLQGSNHLSQTISGLRAGTSYWLQFWYNTRNCCGGTIDLSVQFAGQKLTTITNVQPVGTTNPYNFTNIVFQPTAASGLLEFITTAQGDATLLLDAVNIVQRDTNDVVIANPSFEATGSPVGVGYVQPRTIAGWTLTGGYGVNITGLGPFSDNGTAPDQDRVLFLQGSDSLTQTISGLTTNQPYTLIYGVNARNCCGAGSITHTVQFAGATLVDTEEVDPVGDGNPYLMKYVVFTPTTASGDLSFTTTPDGDHTLLIDNIRIVKGALAAPVLLSLSFDANGLQITWPADATDYTLESTTALPGGWAADNSPVTVNGSQNVISVALTGNAKFYRLRK